MARKISGNKVLLLAISVFGVFGIAYYGLDQSGGLVYELSFVTVNDDGLTIQEQLENKKQEIAEYTREKYMPIERDCLDAYYGKGKGDISMLQRWLNGEPHPNDLPRLKSHNTYYGLGSLQCAGQFGTHTAKTAGILEERSAYENKVTSLNNELEALEKSVEKKEFFCYVRSDITILDIEGNERTVSSVELSPTFFDLTDTGSALDESIMIDSQSGKEIDKFTVSPKISCNEVPAPIRLLSSEITFAVKSQDNDGEKKPTFFGYAQSNVVDITTEDEYEIIKYDIPAKYIYQFLNIGEYTSFHEFYTGGSIKFDYPTLEKRWDSQFTGQHLEIPLQKEIGSDLRVLIETKIAKTTEPIVQQEMMLEDKFEPVILGSIGISPNESLDTLSEFTEILLSEQYEKLNNSKFYIIYGGIFIMIILALVSFRSTRHVVIFRGSGGYY